MPRIPFVHTTKWENQGHGPKFNQFKANPLTLILFLFKGGLEITCDVTSRDFRHRINIHNLVPTNGQMEHATNDL